MANELTADDLVIDAELHVRIRKHTPAEAKAFREAIERVGEYDESIKFWIDENGLPLVLDGRHRLNHWREQPEDTPLKPPRLKEVNLPDRHAARLWILRNQLGRRNVDKDSFKNLVGELYNEEKGSFGGDRRSSDQNDHLKSGGGAAAKVSEETGVSEPTVRRYGKLVEAKNAIQETLPMLHSEIESGTFKLPDKTIKDIGELNKTKMATVRKNLKHGRKWNDGLESTTAAGNGKSKTGDSRQGAAAVVLDDVHEPLRDRFAKLKPTPQQVKAFGEYTAESQEMLLESVEQKRQSLGQAIETGEVPEPTIEEQIKDHNSRIESYCRGLLKHFDETVPSDPWLDHQGLVESAQSKIKSCCSTLRQAKCHAPCPVCEGGGCQKCLTTGRVTKHQYDMLVK